MNEKVIQHFVHCIESHGRHVQYLKFLQTIVKAEGQFIRKCQDMVMQEVRFFLFWFCFFFFIIAKVFILYTECLMNNKHSVTSLFFNK